MIDLSKFKRKKTEELSSRETEGYEEEREENLEGEGQVQQSSDDEKKKKMQKMLVLAVAAAVGVGFMVFKNITSVGGDNNLSSNSPSTFTPPPPPPPGPPAPPPPPSNPPTPTQDTTTTTQNTQTPTTSPSTSQQESQPSSGTASTTTSQQASGNDTQQTTVKTMTGQINPIIGKDEALADLLREKQKLEIELQLKKLQAEIAKTEAEMKEAKGSGGKKVNVEDYRELKKKVNVFEPPMQQPPMQQPLPQQPQLPPPPPQPTISKIDINGIVCEQGSCKAILSTNMGEFSVTDGTNLPDGSRVEKVDSKGVYIVDASGKRLYKPLDLYIPANQGDSGKKSNKSQKQPQTQPPPMIPQSPYIQNYGSGTAQPMPPFINRNPVGGY